MTEKLQRSHEAEIASLRQEGLLSEAGQLEGLEQVREEMEEAHQTHVSHLYEAHRYDITSN